jgi:RecA-family ATPase
MLRNPSQKEYNDEYARKLRFRLVNAERLPPATPREWLVDRLIPHRQVTLLTGDGGEGKTTVALQLLVAQVAKQLFFGRPVRPGPAIYVGCEDEMDEINFVVKQIQVAYPGADLTDLHLVSLAEEVDDPILWGPSPNMKLGVTPLFEDLEIAVARMRATTLVIDAAADVFDGDEMKRAHTRAFIRSLRNLALRQNCAVLLLAHPSVSSIREGRGYSGSTAWNNSVRSRLYMRPPTEAEGEDPDVRVIELAKANRARKGEKLMLRWRDGAFVLDKGGSPEGVRNIREKAEDDIFLRLLDDYVGPLSPHANAINYAPKLFAELPSGKRIGLKRLKEALTRQIAVGTIKVIEEGPPSKLRSRLARSRPS